MPERNARCGCMRGCGALFQTAETLNGTRPAGAFARRRSCGCRWRPMSPQDRQQFVVIREWQRALLADDFHDTGYPPRVPGVATVDAYDIGVRIHIHRVR